MKIICVGRNYEEHARELNNAVPANPVIFLKPKTALLLPDRPCYYPEFTNDLHYEAELVVKINRNGKFIKERFAEKYYDMVTIGIDFTARDIQEQLKSKGLPWEIAKAFDGSAAIGKFIPKEGLDLDQNLNFSLMRNGEIVQLGNTRDMIFKINQIIEYASRYFSLNTGDLIFTGTPAGVGSVKIGDKLEGFIEREKLLVTEIR